MWLICCCFFVCSSLIAPLALGVSIVCGLFILCYGVSVCMHKGDIDPNRFPPGHSYTANISHIHAVCAPRSAVRGHHHHHHIPIPEELHLLAVFPCIFVGETHAHLKQRDVRLPGFRTMDDASYMRQAHTQSCRDDLGVDRFRFTHYTLYLCAIQLLYRHMV